MRARWIRIEPWGSWGALGAYVGLIFFLSARQIPDSPLLFPHWDKVAHLIEYGLLGALSQRAARLTWPRTPWMRRGLVLLCGLGIALLDEQFQASVPRRIPCLEDFAVNVIGLAVGLMVDLGSDRRARRAQ